MILLFDFFSGLVKVNELSDKCIEFVVDNSYKTNLIIIPSLIFALLSSGIFCIFLFKNKLNDNSLKYLLQTWGSQICFIVAFTFISGMFVEFQQKTLAIDYLNSNCKELISNHQIPNIERKSTTIDDNYLKVRLINGEVCCFPFSKDKEGKRTLLLNCSKSKETISKSSKMNKSNSFLFIMLSGFVIPYLIFFTGNKKR